MIILCNCICVYLNKLTYSILKFHRADTLYEGPYIPRKGRLSSAGPHIHPKTHTHPSWRRWLEGLGIVDFCPSQDAALIFISEADIISGSSYKERVIKFRKVNGFLRGIVMAQNTLTSDEFYKLQRFVCVEIGLAILPVQTIEEAAQLLANLVMCEAKFNSNPFRMKPKTASSPDADLLKTTAMIPGLGDKRVRKILQHFGSLKELANATQETLEEVVGAATASSVYNFFHQSFLL
ncbi:Fanconi anemia core complex-associated protein 24 isoform X1 [Cherax quadricarinatus]